MPKKREMEQIKGRIPSKKNAATPFANRKASGHFNAQITKPFFFQLIIQKILNFFHFNTQNQDI